MDFSILLHYYKEASYGFQALQSHMDNYFFRFYDIYVNLCHFEASNFQSIVIISVWKRVTSIISISQIRNNDTIVILDWSIHLTK